MLSGHLNVFCEPYPCGLWENSLPEVVTASGQFPRKPPLSVEGRLSFASLGFYQDPMSERLVSGVSPPGSLLWGQTDVPVGSESRLGS